MTSQIEDLGQDKKTMHKPVSNTQSSYQSECVKKLAFAFSKSFWNTLRRALEFFEKISGNEFLEFTFRKNFTIFIKRVIASFGNIFFPIVYGLNNGNGQKRKTKHVKVRSIKAVVKKAGKFFRSELL